MGEFKIDIEAIRKNENVQMFDWCDEEIRKIEGFINECYVAEGWEPVQHGRVIALRSTDKGRKSSAFAAAMYLAKYDDMANENRFINGMLRAGHSYEPIRGETVTFLFLGVSKPTYDHLITYTLRNRRVAASFRANVPWGFAVPHEAKNKQKYRVAMQTMLNYAEATHEEGEQLQAVRSMYPAGVLLPPFMFDFSEEALVKNVFTQRVWRRGVQGETAEICRDMLECMKLVDPVKWAALEEYHGAHTEAHGKVMRNLRDNRPSLADILGKAKTPIPTNIEEIDVYKLLMETIGKLPKTMWD